MTSHPNLAGRRIVFLSWRDTRNPEGGGAERYLEKMAQGLAERGIEGDRVIEWLVWWDNALLRVLRPQLQKAAVLFVVRDDRVERRAIRTGHEDGDQVEILSGITAGERVVIEGPATLKDGDRVKIQA